MPVMCSKFSLPSWVLFHPNSSLPHSAPTLTSSLFPHCPSKHPSSHCPINKSDANQKKFDRRSSFILFPPRPLTLSLSISCLKMPHSESDFKTTSSTSKSVDESLALSTTPYSYSLTWSLTNTPHISHNLLSIVLPNPI